MGIVYSLPLVVLVLIFALSGVWVMVVSFVIGWMGMVFGWTAFQYLVVHTFTNARHGHDPGYRAWKQGGGDVFFDAQGFPFNFDSVDTKIATPTPHFTMPPDPACPRCGHVGWTLWGRAGSAPSVTRIGTRLSRDICIGNQTPGWAGEPANQPPLDAASLSRAKSGLSIRSVSRSAA